MYTPNMRILTLGNEALNKKAEKIDKIDNAILRISKQMLEALVEGKGVGLAGPQVGLPKRIFVSHVQGDAPRVFINPSILETSVDTVKMEEGCLSVPGLYADVIRPRSIKVQAWNEKGRPFTLDATGILARVILHEYDHLEGVLFIDHLTEAKRNRLIARYDKRIKM
jgi:peptide deformylase